MSHKKVEGTYRNNPLKMPVYSTNLAMFSFSSISIKIINLLLFKDIFLEKNNLQIFIIITIIYLMHIQYVWQVRIAGCNLYILQPAVNFLITLLIMSFLTNYMYLWCLFDFTPLNYGKPLYIFELKYE